VQEGAGEPAQLQAWQLSRREPGEIAELAVGVADLVIGPAEHVHQAHQPDVRADLFAGLAIPIRITLRLAVPNGQDA